MSSKDEPKFVFCGLGPAGMGILTHAMLRGQLDELLADGLALIDLSNTPGAGSLLDYQIHANSLGSVFLECIYELGIDSEFKGMSSFRELLQYQNTAPPLTVVGRFQQDLSAYLLDKLRDRSSAFVWTGHRVLSISKIGVGYEVAFRDAIDARAPVRTIRGRKIFLNLGGTQDLDAIARSSILQGIDLRNHVHKLIGSDAILRMSKGDLQTTFVRPSGSLRRVVIIGFSHSGVSAAMRLADLGMELDNLSGAAPKPLVKLTYRSGPRLFYASECEARESRYVYDPQQDVCPLSGRVNRFSGLRFAARDFAHQLLNRCSGPSTRQVEAISVEPTIAGSHAKLTELLAWAEVIVPAFGYQARTVPLLRPDGTVLKWGQAPDGGLNTSADGQIRDVDGSLVEGLYAFGLGAGQRPSADIGGEPSFEGRIDGVWMYQHDIGAVALHAALSNDRRTDYELC